MLYSTHQFFFLNPAGSLTALCTGGKVPIAGKNFDNSYSGATHYNRSTVPTFQAAVLYFSDKLWLPQTDRQTHLILLLA